jgi:hypothetical protein
MRCLHLWLTVSAVLVAACDQATGPDESDVTGAAQVGAPSASVVVKTPIEETFTAFNDCAGELLEFHIREQLVVHETVDASGGIHFHFVINDKGSTAVGLSSGVTWHQVGATRETDNIRGEAPITVTFVNVFNLISNGSAPNLLIHELFHITINANGVVTALLERSRIECE